VVIVVSIAVVLFIGITIWGIIEAARQGETGWLIAILVGWLVGLGWVVAIAFLVTHPKGAYEPH
jgi:hypothetical protein